MRKFLPFLFLALVPVVASSAPPASYEIRNETFDLGEEGVPIEWKAYPPANGQGTKMEAAEGGGLTITDTDPTAGVGIGQWIKVDGGYKYKVTLATDGEGGLLFVMNFVPRIPPKIGQMNQTKIGEVKAWVPAGEEGVLEGIAPTEAAFAWVWIYSPSKTETDAKVHVKSVKIEELGAVPVEQVPAAATPTPKKSAESN
jgi:hypothetical protein